MPPLNPGERAALVAAAIRTYGITDQQAQHDVDVQSVAPSIVNKLQQALGAGYAGVWFDMHAGKFKIDVAPSTNIASVARVENYFGIAGADSEQVPVSYTWNQLSAVQAKWQPRVRALPASDEATVGINAPDNAVVVSASENAPAADINPLAATAVSENATIGGPPVKVVRSELAPTTLTSCSYSPDHVYPYPTDAYCDAPLRGGIGMANDSPPSYPTCTAGFLTYNPSLNGWGGGYEMMTAGHCITIGAPVPGSPTKLTTPLSSGSVARRSGFSTSSAAMPR